MPFCVKSIWYIGERFPLRCQRSIWSSIMQECHIYTGNGLFMIGDGQAMVVGKGAEYAGLDLFIAHNSSSASSLEEGTASTIRSCASEARFPTEQALDTSRGHGLIRHAHLYPRPSRQSRREAARATIGDSGIQLTVSRLYDYVRHLFFCNGCANLYSSTACALISTLISPDENVAPCTPSRPVRPPSTTTLSQARLLSDGFHVAKCRGSRRRQADCTDSPDDKEWLH